MEICGNYIINMKYLLTFFFISEMTLLITNFYLKIWLTVFKNNILS